MCCCRARGLFCGIWAVVLYLGCCILSVLLYGMWASGYKACSVCGLLNDMRSVVGNVGCCMVCGLLYYM